MSNIRSLGDINSGGGGGRGGGRGGPPGGNPPAGGGGGGGGGFLGGLGNLFGMGGGGGPPGGGDGGGGGRGTPHGRIKELKSDAEFQRELSAAGGRLVVVDFTATWCGPCKMIAPIFAALSEKYTDVVFLKVDVDQLRDTAQECGVRSMPTFQFYIKSRKVDEFSGADPNRLEATIKKHISAATTSTASSSGGGQRLGSASDAPPPPTDSGTSTSTAGILGANHPLLARLGSTVPSSSDNMTSSSNSSSHAPAPIRDTNFYPDPMMKAGLIEMGFPENRIDRALKEVNNSSVQNAMDWIFAHMDDEDIDTKPVPKPAPTVDAEMTDVEKPADDASATTTTTTAMSSSETKPPVDDKPPTLHNALCDTCKNQIIGVRYKCQTCPDYDLCQACYDTRKHPDHEFAAHVEDIVNPQLTPEERALQTQRLQDRIVELRKKKAEDEAKRDVEREIARRKGGQEAIEAKKRWDEEQAKKIADKLKREKEEDRLARERIKAKVEQDKLERAAKAARKSNAAPVPTPVLAPVPAPVPIASSGPAKEYIDAQVQVRLTNGSVLRSTFKPDDTLRTVYDWIVANRTDGNIRFNMSTTFPRRVFSQDELHITLKEAGLVPNGVIQCSKA